MLIVQFNEVNFDIVRKYGHSELPHLLQFIEELKEVKTSSECEYENLEPWIQWVSFYVGKPYKDHKVFHLGEYNEVSEEDLFFLAEKKGKRTGIFGSMNHPGTKDAYYLPDPWSSNEPSPEADIRSFHEIIRFIVNKNAGLSIPWQLLPKLIRVFLSIRLNLKYKIAFYLLGAVLRRDRAVLAGCLDVLLLCFAITKFKSKKLDLAAVFLNGVAHIQHHYMLSSPKIDGSNPDWYIRKDKDPLLACLKVYESAFQTLARENITVSIITGLSQKPVRTPVIYWRFVDHYHVIERVCDRVLSVQPRMSRDFHVYFEDVEQAIEGAQALKKCHVQTQDGEQQAFGFVKQIDNSVFATFIYSGIEDDVILCSGHARIPLKKQIRFVASKNAEHQQQGWAFLPQEDPFRDQDKVTIWDLKNRFEKYLGL